MGDYNMSMPHCDNEVLHAPGMCKFCDMHPDLQQTRLDTNVNFTGEDDPSKDPCPATVRRGLSNINAWDGNKAREPEDFGNQVTI